MITVFNADDHPILKKGITDLIISASGLKWVGSASDGNEALAKIKEIQPDIALLDIEMPHLTGLQVAEKLLCESIQTRFILFTLFKDESLFHNAMKIGIMGYLLKESPESEIINCIESVHAGRAYVNPSLTHILINSNKQGPQELDNLTKHEKNILKLIARQKTSSEIADMLFISPKTVSNHRTTISKKLNLDGKQNGLLKWAMEHKSWLD